MIKNMLLSTVKRIMAVFSAKSEKLVVSFSHLGSTQFFITHPKNKHEMPSIEFINYL